MSTEDEKKITVNSHDGSSHDYEMRGLKEEEIGEWAAFCASVFAYKTNPPPASYFERHFYNDPNRNADLVRVLIDPTSKTIVSSCRIFVRQVSLGDGSSTQAGGIGEVCTDSRHRRRGLSKILLQDSVRIMKQQQMHLSLLHAAPDFFPVYQRGANYACTCSKWSVVTLQLNKLKLESKYYQVRAAQFPQDVESLRSIHQQFSENRFPGCIIRSKDYWNQYLSNELAETLLVLTLQDNDKNQILAWISIRPRGPTRYQVRDFGCDQTLISIQKAFHHLLPMCLPPTAEAEPINLHLPTFLLNSIIGDEETSVIIVPGSVQEENDMGWMYVALSDGAPDMAEINKTKEHLIWPADGF